MASPEKEMIPLEDISEQLQNTQPLLTNPTDLGDAKLPSRPRQKVVIIVGVIAVLIVVAVAASLIGKYVPEYLSEANSKSQTLIKVRSSASTTTRPVKATSLLTTTGTLIDERQSLSGSFSVHADTTSSPVSALSSIAKLVSNSAQTLIKVRSSASTTTRPVKATSLLTTTGTLIDERQSLSGSFSVHADTTSSPVSALSSIAKLVSNSDAKWSRWGSWTDCTRTCGKGIRFRTRKCVAQNQRAVFAPIFCAGKNYQNKTCADWGCPAQTLIKVRSSASTTTRPVKATSLLTTTGTLIDERQSLSGSFSVHADTTSSPVSALSSIAKLVSNSDAKWSRWGSWSDCSRTCGKGTRFRTRKCVAQNQRAVFAPIFCAGKNYQNKTCADWGCPAQTLIKVRSSASTTTRPVKATSSLTTTGTLIDERQSLSGSFSVHADTTSRPVSALSSIAKLVSNSDAKWSRWGSWTDCTRTCGKGIRFRTRKCVAQNQRAVFAPIFCAGKNYQNKTCADWGCPDCSNVCVKGTLNAKCDACTCEDHVLTGRVLTKNKAPLSEAEISLAETPYNVLAQTNANGFFTAFNVCADANQELLIARKGFVPLKVKATILTSTTANVKATLENAVPPFVTVHPQSKMRMSGQSVTFCCEGEGNPPPEIEWFKENNIIDKNLYSYNNTLIIPTVGGLSGTYRCRVVNDFGSEFSDRAVLKVLDKVVDSCSPIPNSKNVTLPDGCVTRATNSSIVDVGECEPIACLKNDSTFNSSCHDPSFCCRPRDVTNVLVECGDIMSFNLSKIKQCSCGGCTEKVTTITGIVVGGPDEEPMRYGDVIYGGQVVAYTDGEGRFSLTIPRNVKRAIVTFQDYYYQEFEERTKVFVINEGSKAFHKIKLKRAPQPITFNVSEPVEIPLGSDRNNDRFADLELSEESFLTEDGSVFQGNAKATISVTDSRNLPDVLTAPGDFTTTDEEGEVEILETFGMVKLKFEDDSGKQLAMSKPMKVFLDPEKLNLTIKNSSSVVPMKLYWLDKKTGRWREAGDFQLEDGSKRRRKRSPRVFFVGTVTPSIAREYLNFDYPTTRVAVRVTTDPYPRAPGSAGVVVRVIRQEEAVYRGYIEETASAEGLVCIPIWRDKTCHIQAESDGKYMIPTRIADLPPNINATIRQDDVNGDIQWIQFESKLDENSTVSTPMYKHIPAEVEKCKSSEERGKGSQFIFQEPSTASDFSILNNRNSDWVNHGCYIKIKVNGENAIFAAESYKGDEPTETGKIGWHIRMSRTADGSNIVCLQFSCPTKDAYTYLKVAPLTRQCTFVSVHDDLSRVQYPACPNEFTIPVCPIQPPAIQGQEKWLWIPKDATSQSTYKTFKNPDFPDNACLTGNQNYNPRSLGNTINDRGYALEYNCRLNDEEYKSTVRTFNWTNSGYKCYVKVKVSGRRSVFKAESYKANKRDLYGYSTDITRPTRDDPSASATCLEYRCSDVLANGNFSENTYITVRPILGDCKFVDTGNNFDFYQNQCPYSLPPQQGVNRSICDVQLPSIAYYTVPGWYNSPYYWRATTESGCRTGNPMWGSLFSSMLSEGYALHYNCT